MKAIQNRAGGATSRGGFTLMEVILSVMIMSFLLVSMSQILTKARATRDFIYNERESQLAGPAILDAIEQDLRALTAFNRSPQALLRIRNRTISGMDADSIDFVTCTNSLMPQYFSEVDGFVRADSNEVGFRLRQSEENDEFLEIFRREGFGIDEEPFDGGVYSFLNERIKGFNIEVFEEDGPEAEPLDSGTWNDDGDDHTGLPARIEIELVLEFAPRITREQLFHETQQKRTVTYRRVFRFSENLRSAIDLRPIVVVPNVPPPTVDAGAAGGSFGLEEDAQGVGMDIDGDATTITSIGGLQIGGQGGAGDLGAVLGGAGGGG